MKRAAPSTSRRSIRRHLLIGLATLTIVGGGLGGWAAMAEISGAVIASGVLVVESNVKKVQHPTGGVVGELRVRDGVRVKAGEIVLRLDETITQANLSVVSKSLDELTARQTRLLAERDGDAKLDFPDSLSSRTGNEDVDRVIAGETRLFELRRNAREGQKSQLKERSGQLREEIQGLTGQSAAKRRELELIGQELAGVRDLWRQNLVQIQKVTALERESARLEGERGQLIATIAQTKGKISETELQIIQIDQELRTEVAKELRDIQSKIAELVERKVTAEDQLRRIDLRAPQEGTVHQLSVYTAGAVIAPGEAVMLIVPEDDLLIVEAKMAPQDIDHLRIGQPSVIRLSAFNQRTTPELNGRVTRISADLTTDQRTGLSYYTVRIGLPESEIKRLQGIRLTPGMPVEAFIKTGDRTVLSYLIKPLFEQITRGPNVKT